MDCIPNNLYIYIFVLSICLRLNNESSEITAFQKWKKSNSVKLFDSIMDDASCNLTKSCIKQKHLLAANERNVLTKNCSDASG